MSRTAGSSGRGGVSQRYAREGTRATYRAELGRYGGRRDLYGRFFDVAGRDGRTEVWAVTSPVNERSIAFHRAMGFTVTGPEHGHMRFRRGL